jgi:hypothetical protein
MLINTTHGTMNIKSVKTITCRRTSYSTVQYSTVQYSTVQYSTVQYSTVQYSTVPNTEGNLHIATYKLNQIITENGLTLFVVQKTKL